MSAQITPDKVMSVEIKNRINFVIETRIEFDLSARFEAERGARAPRF